MKPGWYINTNEYQPRKYWVIGPLPCGLILTLQTKADGTTYHQTVRASSYMKPEGV